MADCKRKPSYVARTIHFEDQGQDFLRWDLTEHGVVIDSQPFQAGVWVGCKVTNPDVEVGECVRYLVPGEVGQRVIRYPVEAIS